MRAGTWQPVLQSLQSTDTFTKAFHRAPWFIVASLLGVVGQITVSRVFADRLAAKNQKPELAASVASITESLPGFDNPLEMTPEVKEARSEAELQDICTVAAEVYSQFEVPVSGNKTMYFEQNEKYVDSFIKVFTQGSVIHEVFIAFTFPVTKATEWQGYASTIMQVNTNPKLLTVNEVAASADTTTLDKSELSWLAAHFVLVRKQPLAPKGERPPQAAPTTMH